MSVSSDVEMHAHAGKFRKYKKIKKEIKITCNPVTSTLLFSYIYIYIYTWKVSYNEKSHFV